VFDKYAAMLGDTITKTIEINKDNIAISRPSHGETSTFILCIEGGNSSRNFYMSERGRESRFSPLNQSRRPHLDRIAQHIPIDRPRFNVRPWSTHVIYFPQMLRPASAMRPHAPPTAPCLRCNSRQTESHTHHQPEWFVFYTWRHDRGRRFIAAMTT